MFSNIGGMKDLLYSHIQSKLLASNKESPVVKIIGSRKLLTLKSNPMTIYSLLSYCKTLYMVTHVIPSHNYQVIQLHNSTHKCVVKLSLLSPHLAPHVEFFQLYLWPTS